MIDISHKITTLRIATAQAIVRVSEVATIQAIQTNTVPKGDVLATSKAAALLAIKKTPDILPFCHPLPIEYGNVQFTIVDLTIIIEVTIKTIYKTGVEVEAMHGASVAALNLYDMLKPIDDHISIENIRLLNKTGGKSDFNDAFIHKLKALVIVCSDTISKGIKEDSSGKIIVERLQKLKLASVDYRVVPDELEAIQDSVINGQKNRAHLIILTGGTGLSVRDVTPEAIKPILDREIPGIAEFARSYGQERMPFALLSRSISGTYKGSLIITVPGSSKGAAETIDALFPHVLHAFKVLRGERHE